MGWPNHSKVPAVQGSHRGDPQPLGRGHERGIHRPQRQVAVHPHKLGYAQPVRRLDRVGREGTAGQVPQESHLGLIPKPGAEKVGDLGADQDRDNQRPGMCPEKRQAGVMVLIIGVDVGVQRPGVDKERYRPTSCRRISSMRSEMSAWPLRPALAALS